jgi:segregation and condensation protein B
MAKNKKNHNEEVVTMIPGSSTIDIGEIRKAQMSEDADLSDELSLDDEAKLIMDELENDSELKKDVLDGYNADDSNDDLEKIAEKVALQSAQEIAAYSLLAGEVSAELTAHNIDLIKEDILLESTIAQELAAEAKEKTPKPAKKHKKIKLDVSLEGGNELSLSESNEEEAIETEEMSEQDLELKAALPQIDENGEYIQDDLQSCISALLFYSDKPLSLKKMKEMLEMPDAEDEVMLKAINGLRDEFMKFNHGFEIAEIAGGYQYRTKIARAPLLRKLAKVQIQRLSRGAMETLTIVAFKQPCTKDDIDQVRGVDSSHFIRTLLDRNLVEVSGRSEAAGRPMIYNTTNTFLEVFGMMDLTGLPSLREIEEAVPQLAAQEEGAEDPRVIQMRKMVHQMKEDSNHLDYNAKEDDQILAEIRDRVKSIDVTTPYLARQKQLAEEGIHGSDAEEILAKEFGFARDAHTGMALEPSTVQAELSLDAELENPHLEHSELGLLTIEESTEMNHVREALENMDIDASEEEQRS